MQNKAKNYSIQIKIYRSIDYEYLSVIDKPLIKEQEKPALFHNFLT